MSESGTPDKPVSEQFPVSLPSKIDGKGVEAGLQSSQGGVTEARKVGRPKGKLGKRTQVFMELILAGKTTLEAYSLAGYKGQKNAAYVLRSQLKDRIEQRLISDGVSREGAKLELQKLMALPLNQTSVSVKEKISILKYLAKITEGETPKRPDITPFLVAINQPKSVTITDQKQ